MDDHDKLCQVLTTSPLQCMGMKSLARQCGLGLGFNRRRQGEVPKMKNEDYLKLTNESSEIFNPGLSDWEKKLCRILWRVEIVQKGENDVPLLVTEEMKNSLDLLF